MNTAVYIKSVPVNRAAIMADRNRMREAVFTYCCYADDKKVTRQQVSDALGFDRQITWSLLQELVRMRLMRICEETRDRQFVFEVAIQDEMGVAA